MTHKKIQTIAIIVYIVLLIGNLIMWNHNAFAWIGIMVASSFWSIFETIWFLQNTNLGLSKTIADLMNGLVYQVPNLICVFILKTDWPIDSQIKAISLTLFCINLFAILFIDLWQDKKATVKKG